MTDDPRGYWRQWLSPSTILPALGFIAAAYGWQVTMDARVASLEKTIERFEREYQRRDLIEQRLNTIDSRLGSIEVKLDTASLERGRGRDGRQ